MGFGPPAPRPCHILLWVCVYLGICMVRSPVETSKYVAMPSALLSFFRPRFLSFFILVLFLFLLGPTTNQHAIENKILIAKNRTLTHSVWYTGVFSLEFKAFSCGLGLRGLLGGSWDLGNKVISTFIEVVSNNYLPLCYSDPSPSTLGLRC